MGDVKARFPKAQFRKLAAAWEEASDVLYAITGEGLSGTIVVRFHDVRLALRAELDAALKDGESESEVTLLERGTLETDDEALSTIQVRWVPDTPFALQRLVSK